MSSNWTFLSVVLSSVLVHIGLASNPPHGKLCFIQLRCKPSSARRSPRPHGAGWSFNLTEPRPRFVSVAKTTGSVQ